MTRRSLTGSAALLFLLAAAAPAAEIELNGKRFTLADGLTIELAASAPLTERPICVDFDAQGRLYIAESSGTNDKVQVQLEQKPHSILRLEDADGDGVFDRRTVFADRLMFPEGCTWHDGSLYVSAPPQIWKLTDTNDDGVADQREVWHDGGTLTGCANDLHGPYVGPDGLIYWCKGAFAEQTYEQSGHAPFVTKASHIFRHDPHSGAVEPVLTGGMDNPVEVAFSRDGEAFLTCTFLQHPAGGHRDGLIHAAYGGVWGKDHGVLAGHPRTGDLMPPLVHLGAAAPCGLTRVESSELRVQSHSAANGQDRADGDSLNSQLSSLNSAETLLACSFNMHKVTRHVLHPAGGTFTTTDSDLLSCDDVDFHPTDVLEDADGSLLVVDTGGWYKLCCPTSQLHKPDVRGAIYRIRWTGAKSPNDPRGLKLDWQNVATPELVARFHDDRFAVRQRAVDEAGKRGEAAIAELARVAAGDKSPEARRLAVWALTRIDQPQARAAVRKSLNDRDLVVRRSAIRSAGLWRDAESSASLRQFLADDDPHTRRAAAEALGRIGDHDAVPSILAAAGAADDDRFLHHAMTFALIQIADAEKTRAGLAAEAPGPVRAALLALDQIPGGELKPEEAIARLDAAEPGVQEAAAWIVERHPEWEHAIAEYLKAKLQRADVSKADAERLQRLLGRFASLAAVRDLLGSVLRDMATAPKARRLALGTMAVPSKSLPASWADSLVAVLDAGDPAEVPLAVEAISKAEKIEGDSAPLRESLRHVAASDRLDVEPRLRALRVVAAGGPLDDTAFQFLLTHLAEGSTGVRLLAADVLATAQLNADQLRRVAQALPGLGPMELDRILPAFAKASDDEVGLALVTSLQASAAATDLMPEKLKAAFEKFGPNVVAAAKPLLERRQPGEAERRAQLDDLLAVVATGDPGRGHGIFQSSKAACSTCHAVGYLGGRIGPDLSGIGKIRTDRDLLESILFPSASFVRSYEPVVVVTTDGQVFGGVPKEEADSVTLQIAADKTATIPRDEIEEMRPGTVSIMPAGLDKQLTPQELADLVAYLKATK